MISRCIEERMEILNTVVAILTNQEYLDTYLDKACEDNLILSLITDNNI